MSTRNTSDEYTYLICYLLYTFSRRTSDLLIMLIDKDVTFSELFSFNYSSLPTIWDSSQISRAEPDGAPSSSASSPISAPPEKLPNARKNSASSEEYHRKSGTTLDSRTSHQQQQYQHHPNREHREYKDYRPKYYNWTPSTVDSSSHNVEYKQTTIHPKVVYDIPKSSHVFVDANTHANKPVNVNSTPRSDNYR